MNYLVNLEKVNLEKCVTRFACVRNGAIIKKH
jgi:hypothetical protein